MFKKRKEMQLKSGLKTGARVGLEVGPDGVSVALVELSDKEPPVLIESEYMAESDPLKQRAILLNWSSRYAKRDLPCIVTLHPTDYQLLLVEPPSVPPKELHSAMRWRLQDLLNYPVEHAVYDLFPVPEDAYRARISMAYVAVAPSAGIKKILSMAEKNGFMPVQVTVRELSFRNLLLTRSDVAKNVLSLWLDSFGGSITLVSDNQIYFSRRLEQSDAVWEPQSLSQELERSVDYAVHQLGRKNIDSVELIYADSTSEGIVRALNEMVEIPVKMFSLSESVSIKTDEKADSNKINQLAAVGAAAYPIAV